MTPAKSALCCRRVSAFRYANDMRRSGAPRLSQIVLLTVSGNRERSLAVLTTDRPNAPYTEGPCARTHTFTYRSS